MTVRLIHRTEVLTQLLSAIAAVPPGQRLHIPALRDALINQGDVIKGIETLIAAGELDAATLRPPVKQQQPARPVVRSGQSADGEPGAPLFAELKAEGMRRGLSLQATSLAVFGNKARIYTLLKNDTVRRKTAERIRAWLAGRGEPAIVAEEAAKPEPEEESTPPPAPIDQGCAEAELAESSSGSAKSAEGPVEQPPSPPAPVSGAELAGALIAYADRHGLAQTRIAKHLFGGSNALGRLRTTSPRAATIEKVRAFLAEPPPPGLAAQPAGGPRVAEVGGLTGAELAADLDTFIETHGLSKTAVGLHLFNSRNGVNVIRGGNPRRATVEKVSAFLGSPPPEELCRQRAAKGMADQVVAEPSCTATPPSGAELAAEIDAFIDRTGANPGRVSSMLFDSGTGIDKLREAIRPKAVTIEKVRLFLERPPEALFAPVRPFNGRPRRDPTERPDTPLMDLADRQRLNGQRHHAAMRRGQEQEAAALVDAGVDPSSVKSTYKANAMREIKRRREEEARQEDPVEQAKRALQKRYAPVCSMAVYGGDASLFMVGSRSNLTRAQLLEMAARL